MSSQSRGELVRAAMPGTSKEIAVRARMGLHAVHMVLRSMLKEGEVVRKTRWLGGKGRHTYVYYVFEGTPKG